MDLLQSVTAWYTFATFSLAFLLCLYFVAYFIIRYLSSLTIYILLKHTIYSSFALGKCFGYYLSWTDIFLTLLYASANGVCMSYRTHTLAEWSARAASLLATNTVLLLPGASISADTLHISLRTYQKVHHVIGFTTLVEGIVHTSIALSTQTALLGNTSFMSGIIAFVSLCIICLTSLPMFRRRVYELFRIFHFVFSAAVCASLWFHISTSQRLSRIQAIVGSSLWLGSYMHRIGLILYRNHSWSRASTRMTASAIDGAVKVNVTLARPWKIRPGQYVYLTMRRAGVFSLLQRHPFMITESPEYNSIQLRIQPLTGFTRRLLDRVRTPGVIHQAAYIEGPYGTPYDFNEFGTVVMFASGIGITGHLSYIREILHRHQQLKTKTRDILLIWYAETLEQCNLVSEFMQQQLKEDREVNGHRVSVKAKRVRGSSEIPDRPGVRPAPLGENILDIYIFRDDLGLVQDRRGERIAEVRGPPDVPQIIVDVVHSRTNGKIAVSVCASEAMRSQVREEVARSMHKNMRFVELDFQPPEVAKVAVQKDRSMSVQCRGIT